MVHQWIQSSPLKSSSRILNIPMSALLSCNAVHKVTFRMQTRFKCHMICRMRTSSFPHIGWFLKAWSKIFVMFSLSHPKVISNYPQKPNAHNSNAPLVDLTRRSRMKLSSPLVLVVGVHPHLISVFTLHTPIYITRMRSLN